LTRSTRRSLIAASVLAACASACATPLLHPLRANQGPYAEGAISYGSHAGKRGSCDNYEGCVESQGGGGGHIAIMQFGGGYSHVLYDHIGLMAGFHFPAWEDFKSDKPYGALGLTTFITAQNDYVSVGAGPELGVGGWAVTVGGEVQPWGKRIWFPCVGVYGRRFWPFSPTDEEFDNRVATWEAGGRIRSGPIVLGYEYYMQDEGAMYWTIFETASFAQGHHTFTLGLSIDMDTVRAVSTKH
jgi:hypothetical protein